MMSSARTGSWITFAIGLAVALGCAIFDASADRTAPAVLAAEEAPVSATPAPKPTPAVAASDAKPAAAVLDDVSATSKTDKVPPKEGNKAAKRLGVDLSSDAPLEIVSQSFEMVDEAKGGERMRFRGQVKLKQGDAELRCDRLDAYYPEGAGSGRPQSLVATGDVQLVQGEFEMRCTRATFDDANCLAVCLSSETCQSGKWPAQPARFKRGVDWIEGRELEVNLCTGKLYARCGARLQVAPKQENAATQDKAAKPGSKDAKNAKDSKDANAAGGLPRP
jgi:hypothetical protein